MVAIIKATRKLATTIADMLVEEQHDVQEVKHKANGIDALIIIQVEDRAEVEIIKEKIYFLLDAIRRAYDTEKTARESSCEIHE